MGQLLTVREVANQFRVDETTVRRWIKTGALEAIALPSSSNNMRHGYRIKSESVQKVFDTPYTETVS